MLTFAKGALVALGFLGMASTASAATIISAATGIADADRVIGFDEVAVANGGAVTNQYAGLGVSFTPQLVYLNSVSPRAGFAGPALVNFQRGQTGGFDIFDPFSIIFTSAVEAASFAFTRQGSTKFEAFLNGSLVESFTATTFLNSTNFFGFSGSLFDEIRLTAEVGSRFAALDTLAIKDAQTRVAVTPLPASAWMLLAAILALLAVRGWRRRRV